MSRVGARTWPRRGPARSGRPPARDHRGHLRARVGGGPQGGAGPGARPEISDRQAHPPRAWSRSQPRHLPQPAGQKLDVEHVGPVQLLVAGEQVEQQRGQPAPGSAPGPRTGCGGCGGCCRCRGRTRPCPVGSLGHGELSGQTDTPGDHLDLTGMHRRVARLEGRLPPGAGPAGRTRRAAWPPRRRRSGRNPGTTAR